MSLKPLEHTGRRARLLRAARAVALSVALTCASRPVQAQPAPQALQEGIALRLVAGTEGAPVRIAHDPVTDALYYLTLTGDLYRIAPPYAGGEAERAFTAADHGLGTDVMGLAVDAGGTIYLVGNDLRDSLLAGVVVRGRPAEGGRYAWSTVARTAFFPRSGTAFDHKFNGIAVSPDGAHLYVNSGSRTDHGEVQSNEGRFPGLREVPLTSAVFRIPADARDLLLPDDEAALRQQGYLFADGVRNTFDLAFDAAGNLFGTENAGDRDDPDELNWLQEGGHYGFPWRLGDHDNPQQFPGYRPEEDLLLDPEATAVRSGFFHDDPAFPPPPAGVAFTDPVRNGGPDADRVRDPATGAVRDASAGGGTVATFTPHRSPLGLVFDVNAALPAGFRGDAFVLGWTMPGDPLLGPFGEEGGDLLHLRLRRAAGGYEAGVRRIVRGFDRPVDAVLVRDRLYVLESGGPRRIWEVTFGKATSAAEGTHPAPSAALRVYPNPASRVARFTLQLARPRDVRVEVYSVLGARVARLHDGLLPAGSPHAFTLEAAHLPSGVYFVRVAGDGIALSRPFVLRHAE